MNAKLDRDIKSCKDKLRGEIRVLELDLKQSMRSFQKQRARDKADMDLINQ